MAMTRDQQLAYAVGALVLHRIRAFQDPTNIPEASAVWQGIADDLGVPLGDSERAMIMEAFDRAREFGAIVSNEAARESAAKAGRDGMRGFLERLACLMEAYRARIEPETWGQAPLMVTVDDGAQRVHLRASEVSSPVLMDAGGYGATEHPLVQRDARLEPRP